MEQPFVSPLKRCDSAMCFMTFPSSGGSYAKNRPSPSHCHIVQVFLSESHLISRRISDLGHQLGGGTAGTVGPGAGHVFEHGEFLNARMLGFFTVLIIAFCWVHDPATYLEGLNMLLLFGHQIFRDFQ